MLRAYRKFVVLVLAMACATPAAAQSVFDLPAIGEAREETLGPAESHEWRVELAATEFLEIAIEPLGLAESDAWPVATVLAPDGAVRSEGAGPDLVPSLDDLGRTIVSFVAMPSGSYRLRVTRGTSALPVRYRLRLDTRRFSVEDDRQRLRAHQLWRDGGRLFLQGTPESLRGAAAKYEEARTLLAGIGDEREEALTLNTIAKISYDLSDAPRGTTAETRALEIWRRRGSSLEEGRALSDLGLLAYLAYDHATARRHYDEALSIHRAAADVIGEARTLSRIGWVHYAAAELQDVVDINQDALVLYRQGGDRIGESTSFNDLGRAYLDLGDASQALDAYQQALALRPPDRYPRGAANVLIRMGIAYLGVAEWQRGLDVLQQALTLSRRGNDHRAEISSLVNLGSAYVTLGDTAEGSRYLEPALELARAIDFRGAEGYALLWLGVGASLNRDFVRSRDYLQQAIAVQTAIKDVRSQATTLRQLAAVQLELGLAQDALESINKSVDVSPQASGLIYTASLTQANVYAALGDVAQAQARYEEAIRHFREIGARQAEALALTRFGRFQASRGQYADGHDLLQQAVEVQDSLRGLIVDPDLRMSYTSTSIGPYELYVDVLMELARRSPASVSAAEAFHATERARARGFLEMLATSGVDIREGVDRALVERERSLRWDLNTKVARQTALLAGSRDPRRLAALETDIADLTRAWRETTTSIRQQSPAYASLTEPQPLKVDDVQQLLDANTVLLEFGTGETRSWLFALTKDSFEWFPLAARASIEDAARAFHRLLTARQPLARETAAARQLRIARADADLNDSSRRLSDLVLGPVADKLRNDWRGRRLAIVAAGALEYVPFAALPMPSGSASVRDRRLIIAAHEIVTLPSASSLAFLRRPPSRRPSPQKAIAVFADPVFAPDDPRVRRARPTQADRAASSSAGAARAVGRDDAQATRSLETRALEPFVADEARGSLARLPFSRAEAAAIAAYIPAASQLQATDFAASLTTATSGRLADYRIVHFATHGLINTSRPELSGLALSLVDEQGRSREGFLRLNTIYNLRLSADLVVLSACQSALGKEIAGEGLVGLTRGFMYAGARRVVASLWQVSDAATAELMKKFYAGMLQDHLPPSGALRKAQLEMASDPRWRSPYYWAAFVVQGDWK